MQNLCYNGRELFLTKHFQMTIAQKGDGIGSTEEPGVPADLEPRLHVTPFFWSYVSCNPAHF